MASPGGASTEGATEAHFSLLTAIVTGWQAGGDERLTYPHRTIPPLYVVNGL